MENKLYQEFLELFETTLQYERGTLHDELLVKTDLAIDSLKFIDYLIKIEDKYSVDLMDDFDEIEDITIRDLCNRLCELIEKKKLISSEGIVND